METTTLRSFGKYGDNESFTFEFSKLFSSGTYPERLTGKPRSPGPTVPRHRPSASGVAPVTPTARGVHQGPFKDQCPSQKVSRRMTRKKGRLSFRTYQEGRRQVPARDVPLRPRWSPQTTHQSDRLTGGPGLEGSGTEGGVPEERSGFPREGGTGLSTGRARQGTKQT